MKAILVPAAIQAPISTLEIPAQAALDALQAAVGGYIQTHPTPASLEHRGPVAVYLNEEGKLRGLPSNARATALFLDVGLLLENDFIAGELVLLGFNPRDGSECDCPLSVSDLEAAITRPRHTGIPDPNSSTIMPPQAR